MFLVLFLVAVCAVLCNGDNLRKNYIFDGERSFKEKAMNNTPTTDKVTDHSYQKMYGRVLLPMIEKFELNKKKLKFLEIGLGCDMSYGPGASAKVWRQIFEGREVDLWEAEFNAECVKKSQAEGKLEGINTLTGDQANPGDLKRWIEQSGGNFDVIIDDGGHKSDQVLKAFTALWPQLNPDGNYFIEDLQIAYHPGYTVPNVPPVTKVIQAWVEMLNAYPLPAGLDFISCQREACVLHKQPVRR